MKFLYYYLNPGTTSILLISSVMCWIFSSVSFTQKKTLFLSWELGSASSWSCEFLILLDPVSLSFLGTVLLISSMVLLFSLDYMAGEKFFIRFHMLVFSFIFSMILLILSPNLWSLLLGWDGLGMSSYLLVIYFNSPKSFNAGMVTAMTNRIGDVLLLLSLAPYLSLGTWDMSFISYAGGPPLPPYLPLLLITACFTKSAQIPFSAWLPAAMAAPTPVSALVHSSTLVTAGVYVLIRFSDQWTSQPAYLLMIGGMGAATMIMAGVSALYEMDMKKVVALSTLSQLGLMVCSLGLGFYELAFIHLLAHAFFKALLFISVGNLIHLSSNYQDLRKISHSASHSRISLGVSLGANLSLCGFPYLAGFFSKDGIIESALSQNVSLGMLSALYLGVCLTLIYSLRFMLMLLIPNNKTPPASWSLDWAPPVFISEMTLWLGAVGGGAFLMSILTAPFHPTLPLEMKNLIWVFLGLSGLSSKPVFNLPHSIFWSWGSLWTLPLIPSQVLSTNSLELGGQFRLLDLTWETPSMFLTHSTFQTPPFSQSGTSPVFNSYLLLSGWLGVLWLGLY